LSPPAGGAEEAPAATDTALAALAGLGLDQVVAHTEIKLTSAGPRVVEVNPRPAGNRITELVRHVTGIDLAGACVDLALGRAPATVTRPTGVRSAAIGFLVPGAEGVVEGYATEGAAPGPEELASLPGVLEVRLAEPGTRVRPAADNNGYLGHIMAADTEGGGARERVTALLNGVRPRVVAA
jgi:biotin carboxylase